MDLLLLILIGQVLKSSVMVIDLKLKIREIDDNGGIRYREKSCIDLKRSYRGKMESIIAFYDNVRPPCGINDGHCQSPSSTYYWSVSNLAHCPLYDVKTIRGQILTSSMRSGKVLSSTDNSLVRFVIKDSFKIFRQRAMRTNYKEIVIVDTLNADGTLKAFLVKRPLPKDKISFSIFITNRDDTLYHRAKEQICKEFVTIMKEDCHSNLEKSKTQHFLERKMPNFHLYRLGRVNYVTTAGELTYFYKCEPKLTVTIKTKTCYDALPIEIVTNPKQAMRKQLPTFPSYFLEPVTHRISQTAQEIPGIPRFFSRYKDIFDRWFAITPTFERMDPPEIINVQMLNRAINVTNIYMQLIATSY